MGTKVLSKLGSSWSRIKFATRAHAPEILAVAGTVGVVVSGVMACKATIKAQEVVKEAKDSLDQIHDLIADESVTEETYSEEDSKKDIVTVYTKAGVGLIKIYAPSVALGALSLTSMLASNKILRKRNIALAAAYATIDKSFKEYRGRVVERYGKRVDYELKNNIKAVDITSTTIDENGKEQTETKTVDVVENGVCSDYAVIFDKKNRYYRDVPDYDMMFLRAEQAYANDKLKANKKVFLNDVYEALGFEHTKAGQIVGWTYDPENPYGDNFVDFEIKPIAVPTEDGEYETAYLLNFNVDGNIWKFMK